MKICKVHLKNVLQFQDLELDFTNPETGEPANKICFIGKNGTGKTTLLEIVKGILVNMIKEVSYISLIKIKVKDKFIYRFTNPTFSRVPYFFSDSIDTQNAKWFDDLTNTTESVILNNRKESYNDHEIKGSELSSLINYITFNSIHSEKGGIIIFSPAESIQNKHLQINDVPTGTVNDALQYFNNPISTNIIISNESIDNFWIQLIYLIKKRESEFIEYQNLEENQLKTIKQLKEDFDKDHPKILDEIARLWNRILLEAGLEFDIANAKIPIQLKDNLEAYIVLKDTRRKIPYSGLSTGIRNYIFRIGHLYTLFFSEEINRGFVFIDEPENSLHPDFLFDLIETYLDVLKDKNGKNNAQLFIATHSPIIAAQFQPYERIILEWQDDATVKARKGTAPIGDDPNDILTQDFELASLMGKEGRKMWDRYLELKKQLRRTVDVKVKDELAAEISEIGSKYKFEE